MKILDFIKGYNAYKLTDEQTEKAFANKNLEGLSTRIELGLVNSERCRIDADVCKYYDEELGRYVTSMIFEIYEVTAEDFWSLQEAYKTLQAEKDFTSPDAYTYENSFKHIATYKCDTNKECRDFLITLIKNLDFDISV